MASNALGRLDTHFADVVSVLGNAEYCGGLGLPPAPSGAWPRSGNFDGDGAALVEELSQRAIADDLSTSVWTSVINVAYRWWTAIRDYNGEADVPSNRSLFMSSGRTS